MIARPWRLRLIARAIATVMLWAVLIVAATTAVWAGDGLSFEQVAMPVAGAGVAVVIAYVGGRPRVEVDDAGVRVVNLVGHTTVPWSHVAGVRHGTGARYATLETVAGDVLSVHAIRSVDGQYAVEAVARLRKLSADGVNRP
ncbi:PH domain-containing protein [Longispora fulva]|uniref:Low molecular weight protein antigen 6 PH domain-containing protein n=1 Tax=Longispora fulva TaxID=619741 RepID=A0A8J7GM86_9ACTN|nr:PH domain-containing protein [Longispora fulva]MBG6135629.1 hypothetical protein [Longispora fulva]